MTVKFNGFSLIEISLVLAIISLLAVIALPAYTHHLTVAHHLQAKKELIQLASALEHYYIEHGTYQDASIEKLGLKNENKMFRLVIVKVTSTGYLISAISRLNDAGFEPISLDDTGTIVSQH